MPKSIEEILAHADELAEQFENLELGEMKDATTLRHVRQAVLARADSERHLAEAVAAARADSHSWAAIGAMVGTTGEAARQRYGIPTSKR